MSLGEYRAADEQPLKPRFPEPDWGDDWEDEPAWSDGPFGARDDHEPPPPPEGPSAASVSGTPWSRCLEPGEDGTGGWQEALYGGSMEHEDSGTEYDCGVVVGAPIVLHDGTEIDEDVIEDEVNPAVRAAAQSIESELEESNAPWSKSRVCREFKQRIQARLTDYRRGYLVQQDRLPCQFH